jgi:hypothetical protein
MPRDERLHLGLTSAMLRRFVMPLALLCGCAEQGSATPPATAPALASPAPAVTTQTTPPLPADAATTYAALDAEIRSTLDYETGHAHYSGDAALLKERYAHDYEHAESQLRPRLEAFARNCGEMVCHALAHARIGSLFESMRTGLAAAPFVMPKTLRLPSGRVIDLAGLLDAMEQNGQLEEMQKLTDSAHAQWTSFIAGELETLDQKTVVQYVAARVLATRYGIHGAPIDRVARRLVALTRIYGEEKMRAIIESLDDPDPSQPGKKVVYDGALLRE